MKYVTHSIAAGQFTKFTHIFRKTENFEWNLETTQNKKSPKFI